MFFSKSTENPETLNSAAPDRLEEPDLPGRPWARPLVPVVLALMAGITATAWGLHVPPAWGLAALVGLWGVLAYCWWQARPVRLVPLLLLALLGVALSQQARQPYFPPDSVCHLPLHQQVTLLGRLNRPGKMGENRVQLFMAAQAWLSPRGWEPVSGNVLVTVPSLEPPPVGTEVVGRGRLAVPDMLHNPGSFKRPRYLAADGLFRQMRLRDPQRLIFLASTAAYPLAERLRGGIREQLRSLPPVCRAMYLAMLLGDQGEITPAMRRNFARTNTSHLLVINGLHLGMVAAVTYVLCFWLLRCFPGLLLRLNVIKVSTLVAALPVIFYAYVAGGSPSTQRAEVMVLAFLLLVFLGRPKEVWSALALAALIILSWSPLRLFSISFQLSFVAVATLIYVVPRLVAGLKRMELPRGVLSRGFFRAKEWLVVSVVAGLATAPLVAHYFQVVSLLGILVNVVAIPLVLLLALPLGEAAVITQACHLTPLAQGLLFVGKIPLWLGYQTIQWAAHLPGSAFVVATPTWLEIGAYYLLLIMVFAPWRASLKWAGAGVAAVVMVTAAALPLVTVPQALEVTCLDAYGGLRGVLVTPENRRVAVSAAEPLRWGQTAPTWGPLPRYCHWRQFRHLDLVMALNLGNANAAELLTLAEQFRVGAYWYGKRGRGGPAAWDLWNYLGDRGQVPHWLARGQPPASLGSVALHYIQLSEGGGVALEATYQGRRAWLIPPARGLTADALPVPQRPLTVLVIPARLCDPRDRQVIMTRLDPQRVIIYGGYRHRGAPPHPWPIPCQYTRQGAVSVYLTAAGVTARQWRP